MNEFIDRSKNLDGLGVSSFVVDPDLSADDFVETIRRLLGKLKC